jgi:hypothetical protein
MVVLSLDLFEPLGLIDLQSAELLSPAIVALRGDLSLLAGLGQSRSIGQLHFNLAQQRDDLFR